MRLIIHDRASVSWHLKSVIALTLPIPSDGFLRIHSFRTSHHKIAVICKILNMSSTAPRDSDVVGSSRVLVPILV